jgi:CheY-like chemotaxis protein
VLARAAEPFFTTKEVGKGSGLGLAMVHGVAAQSGGTLRILSTLRQGTTVEIWLPRAPTASAAAKPAGSKPPPRAIHAGTRVLVIDDDREVRDFVAECLRTAGCSVTAVASGAEGLACLDRHPFDAVVTDFAMPGMTGLEVAAAARTKHPDLPIAVITGYADARMLDTSGLPVLYKPFSPDELTDCVSDLLVRERETTVNGDGGPGP